MTQSSKLPILQMPRSEVERRLDDRIAEGKKLSAIRIQNASELGTARKQKSKWADYNRELLKRIINTEDLVNDYDSSDPVVFFGPTSLGEEISDFYSYLERNISKLESIRERLELIPESQTPYVENLNQRGFPSTSLSLQQRSKLLQILCDYFSESDLRTLCFHLGVDYDVLPDIGKNNKARELIVFLERLDRVQELIDEGKKLRPNSKWNFLARD